MLSMSDMPPRHKHDSLKGFPGLTFYTKKLKDGRKVKYWRLNGKAIGSGTEDDAKQAYLLYMGEYDRPNMLDRMVNEQSLTWTNVIESFEREYPKWSVWADRTKQEHKIRLAKYKADLGRLIFKTYSLSELSSYIKTYKGDGRVQARNLLIHVYRYAVSEGWIESNLAQMTLPPVKGKRARKRLGMQQFNSIRAKAEPWLQNAMDLALLTCQGPTEVLNMKADDIRDGYLYIIRQKTKDRTDTAYIKLWIDSELDKVIKRCRSFHPYLVNRKPKHPIKPDYLTKAFYKARAETGLYDDWEAKYKPVFKEIRSLGARLLEDKGVDKMLIKSLLGHTTMRMTEVYLDDDESKFNEVKVR